jgi:hypothetical protein
MTKITNSKRFATIDIQMSGLGHCDFEFWICLSFGACDLLFPVFTF